MTGNESNYDGEPRELPEPDLTDAENTPSEHHRNSILNEARHGEHGTPLGFDPRESDISGNPTVPDDKELSTIEQEEIERQRQLLRDMGVDPDVS
jgi:hypothetical protein